MEERFDVIVIGLGAMGSATAYQLAKSGAKVLGIDQFAPPHTQGSTHGDSRITRQAIGEGDHYTPIVLRAYEIWREIEAETGKDLLTVTGGLIISGGKDRGTNHMDEFFDTTLAAAKKYNIEHELLTADEIRARFPQFNVGDDERGYFEKMAGFLRPEACIEAQLELAERYEATIRKNEKVEGFKDTGDGVTVKTSKGQYSANKLVVTAGPWFPKLFPEYEKYFSVRRQIMFWFDVKESIEPFMPQSCPVYIWELPGRETGIYGFPAIDGSTGGVKVASEQHTVTSDAEHVDRTVTEADIDDMYDNSVAPFLPGLSRECVKHVTCLYTVTPDFEFVIDFHPENKNIILASPCSGHGFKHSAAIGEILSQLATRGKSDFDIRNFSIERLSSNNGR